MMKIICEPYNITPTEKKIYRNKCDRRVIYSIEAVNKKKKVHLKNYLNHSFYQPISNPHNVLFKIITGYSEEIIN